MKTVVGVFSDAREAQRTYEELVNAGFGAGGISVLTSRITQPGMNLDLRPIESKDAGPITGRGPLALAISGRDRGHELAGSLRDYGLSMQLSEHYAKAVRLGETLESIVVEDRDADRALAIMSQRAAPYESTERISTGTVGAGGGAVAAAGTAGIAAVAKAKATMEATTEREEIARRDERRLERDLHAEDRSIPVLEEQLRVGKREVERGHVHVSIRVTEHPVSENLNLREEHVYVERRPANRPMTGVEKGFQSEDLDITEYGEEPVVAKDVKVVEEIVISKRLQSHDEMISDAVRKTQVDVTEDRFEPGLFRKHFDSLGMKGKFEEHLPAYELGHTLRGSGGKRWEEVEPMAKARWEAKRPGTWDKIKDSVKYSFSREK